MATGSYKKYNIKHYKPKNTIFRFLILLYSIFLVSKALGNDLVPYLAFFVLCVLIYNIPKIIDKFARRNSNFSENQFKLLLRGFTPRQFEVFCYEYFQALGYNAYLSAPGPDGGKDVILDKRIYVECKRYNETTIGREICQKLLGAVVADNKEEGILFTNGELHENALEFIKKTDKVKLWDVDTIYRNSIAISNDKLSRIIDTVAEIRE